MSSVLLSLSSMSWMMTDLVPLNFASAGSLSLSIYSSIFWWTFKVPFLRRCFFPRFGGSLGLDPLGLLSSSLLTPLLGFISGRPFSPLSLFISSLSFWTSSLFFLVLALDLQFCFWTQGRLQAILFCLIFRTEQISNLLYREMSWQRWWHSWNIWPN